MTQAELLQVLWGTLGTAGFAVLFNIRRSRLVAATAGGLLSWLIFLILNRLVPNEPVNYFVVSVIMSAYAEVMARVLKTPTTTFITTTLVPLIPGGSLYYTMSYAFQSDLTNFLEKAIYTLQLASALALGIIVATNLTKIVVSMLNKWKRANQKE